MFRLSLLCIMALGLTGCATYEFQIVQPPNLAQHIGSKQESNLNVNDLVYHMQAVEGRLVLRIENPGNDAIELVAAKSYVVNPANQSRPLRGQSIAPKSYMKLILPPMRPVYRAQPSIGIGFGIGAGRFHHGPFYDGYAGDFYDEPVYLEQVSDGETVYWDWNNESSIRLHLAFQRRDQSFENEWVIKRQKM